MQTMTLPHAACLRICCTCHQMTDIDFFSEPALATPVVQRARNNGIPI
jgi:hypothetical protein